MHSRRSIVLALLALLTLASVPAAVASETICADLPAPACAYDGTAEPEPTCNEAGSQEARFTGVGIGERDAAIHAGWWEDCSNDGTSSSSYERLGTWVFLGGFLLDAGVNHYSTDDGSGSSDLYVVHAGVPAAWYYEDRSSGADACFLHVRVALSIGTQTATPCVSEHAPGVLP